MSEQDNQRIVQTLFERFGQGDIPAIIGMLSDDVNWEVIGPDSVPYYGPRRGHEGVLDFFANLGGNVEFESFEPQEFSAVGDKVIVLGRERGRVKVTGKTFDQEWAMVFIIRDGKVTSFRCYENTAVVTKAFQGGKQ